MDSGLLALFLLARGSSLGGVVAQLITRETHAAGAGLTARAAAARTLGGLALQSDVHAAAHEHTQEPQI